MNTMTELQNRVHDAFLEDDDLHDHGIEVLDSNGVITLRGWVHTVAAREKAEVIAQQVPGVTSVINELNVV
jgi:osmotically-inducible protein OsmY